MMAKGRGHYEKGDGISEGEALLVGDRDNVSSSYLLPETSTGHISIDHDMAPKSCQTFISFYKGGNADCFSTSSQFHLISEGFIKIS